MEIKPSTFPHGLKHVYHFCHWEIYGGNKNRRHGVRIFGLPILTTPLLHHTHDKVLDVTWRYTNKQNEVMQRRKQVPEKWIVDVCQSITKEVFTLNIYLLIT